MKLTNIWKMAAVVALACGGSGAVGCGSSSNKPSSKADAGTQPNQIPDASADAGEEDASVDSGAPAASGPKSKMCGSTLCEGNVLVTTPVDACCTTENKCGLNADQFPPPSALSGCIERDAPGVKSDLCGAFFDQVETDPKADHHDKQLLVSGQVPLNFPGCCTPEGICGASLSSATNLSVVNLHLGCMSYLTLQSSLAAAATGDAGTPNPADLPILPYCNPQTGAAPTSGKVPGAPTFVCGCGKGKMSPQNEAPCLNNLVDTVCGADTPSADQLALIPEFVCGCGTEKRPAGEGLPCLQFTATKTCGSMNIPNSAALAQVAPTLPNIVCGCGDGKSDPTAVPPCLANVATTACGPVAACSTLNQPCTPEGGAANSGVCLDSNHDGTADVCYVSPQTTGDAGTDAG